MLFAQLLVGLGVALAVVTVALSRRLNPACDALPDEVDLADEGGPPVLPSAALTLADDFEQVQLGALGVAGALLVFFVGRDLSATYEGMPNQVRLLPPLHLQLPPRLPGSLDFTPSLWAFTLAAALLMLLLVVRRLRRHVSAALLALGLCFAAWGLNVYFMKTSPHWGQRERFLAYYDASREESRARSSPIR